MARSIGGIEAIHTAVICACGVLLAGIMFAGFLHLETGQARSEARVAALGDLARLEDAVAQWMLMGDLVFASGETYLVDGTLRLGDTIQAVATKIRKSSLGAEAEPEIAALDRAVDQTAGHLQRAAELEPDRDAAEFAELLDAWDGTAGAVLDNIAAAHDVLLDASDQQRAAFDELRRLVVAGELVAGVLYLLLVFAMWRWVRRQIVAPLGALTESADTALRLGEAHDLKERGPVEVRRLARSVRAFITELEGRVAERTAKLARREQDLVEENRIRRAAEADASRALAVAEEASRAKDEFLANMSHEIRTPLNGVLGSAQLLQQTPLSDEQRSRVDTVMSSGQHLLGVINDVLDYSKLAAERVDIDPAPVETRELLSSVARMFEAQARERSVELMLDVDPDLPDWIDCDALRVRQVLTNLLGNAMKFTSDGYVRVVARQEGERLCITVADTGIGIPADRQAAIFQPFTQADGSTTRLFGGTGLGLSIARQLVTLMGGTLGVESEPGIGSTFWFELPLVATAARPAETSGAGGPVDDAAVLLAGTRVLLAEDNPINQMVARAMLESMACEVSTADDGPAALAAWQAGDFDAILMDWHMPGMDGLEVTRRIRAEEQSEQRSRVPVIALTANSLEGDVEACLDAGMDAYLAKPVEFAALAGCLGQLVGGQPALRASG